MMYTIKAILLTIAGWFIIPVLAWRTPATATHYRWLEGILTAINTGWPLPADFVWIDSTNKNHPADITFLKGLAITFANNRSKLFARLQVAKTLINNAKTITAINEVNF